MANRYYTAVNFAMEKNVVQLFLRGVFDASGNIQLDPINSKGICAINHESIVLTGNTVASSTSVSSITSFYGLFNGMDLSGSTATIGTGVTISSMNANTQVLTLSTGTNALTQPANTLIATGGRYRVQFGFTNNTGPRLDTYNRLLGFSCEFREVTASATGSRTQLQLFPAAADAFIVDNQIGVRTIPQTATTASTDASVAVQFGYYGSTNGIFSAATPKPGEVVHMTFFLSNSTAV